MAERGQNGLIVVAGHATTVTNSAIAGIIDEVGRGMTMDEVFGATAGLPGLLDNKLMDMGAQKRKMIEGLRRTPGSVLPGRYRPMSEADAPTLIIDLMAKNIGTMFFLGGSPAIEAMRFVSDAVQKFGYPLLTLGVPLSAENEVGAGDHTPGYGSAARFAASAVRDAGLAAQGGSEPLLVIELLGAQNGWLAAASALARDAQHSAPHAILTPERAVERESLIEELRRAYQKFGFVVAVTTEGARDTEGNALDGDALLSLLKEQLNLAGRCDKPGSLARVAQASVARADGDDAYHLGTLAVQLAADECSDYLVLVNRDIHANERDKGYKTINGSARLEQVPTETRALPAEYLSESGNGVSDAFLDWVKPLVGGALPEYISPA